MKKVIIDTNILFAALRGRNRKLRTILSNKQYQFYAPHHLFVEIFKHKERILSSTKGDESEVYDLLHLLFQEIRFVNETQISIENFVKAYYLCKETDENDMLFIALALELNADIWTKDEKLKKGLIAKDFHQFIDIFE
jgi:predicted nucleic acid-binding protein